MDVGLGTAVALLVTAVAPLNDVLTWLPSGEAIAIFVSLPCVTAPMVMFVRLGET